MHVELKVGQVWKDRSGIKIAIVKNTTGRNKDSHPFMSFSRPWTYRSDGGFAYFSGMSHERDLIELVQDENGWLPWKATADRQCPVARGVQIEVRFNSGARHIDLAGKFSWSFCGFGGFGGLIVAYRIVEEAPKASKPVEPARQEPPAILMLQAAADHMRDRAATYDKPDGERSMSKTVDAFNAVTSRDLSEAEGWLLLQILKDVRLFQRPGYHADSAEDCVAYAALKAEAKMAEASNARP